VRITIGLKIGFLIIKNKVILYRILVEKMEKKNLMKKTRKRKIERNKESLIYKKALKTWISMSNKLLKRVIKIIKAKRYKG